MLFISLSLSLSLPPSLPPSLSTPDLRLGHNVCYIVACVVVEGGKVLMVQEAKMTCRGRWYLPAGRVEMDETIMVRE